MYLSLSELLALRSEEEWEEVRQRINDLPQDEALTAEFAKVPSALLIFYLFFIFLFNHQFLIMN